MVSETFLLKLIEMESSKKNIVWKTLEMFPTSTIHEKKSFIPTNLVVFPIIVIRFSVGAYLNLHAP